MLATFRRWLGPLGRGRRCWWRVRWLRRRGLLGQEKATESRAAGQDLPTDAGRFQLHAPTVGQAVAFVRPAPEHAGMMGTSGRIRRSRWRRRQYASRSGESEPVAAQDLIEDGRS